MNPEHTIRTGAAGRRAAAIRDGRGEAGDATTQVIRPCDWCNGTGLMRVMGTHDEVACTHCARA